MLQSMFAVTFTAYKDTKWLYTTIKYLFENTENLNEADFGDEFYRFLESLSKSFTKERICNSKGQVDAQRLRNDNSVPVYAFNLTDYVLWKNSGELKSEFTTINFDDFPLHTDAQLNIGIRKIPTRQKEKKNCLMICCIVLGIYV